MDPEADIDRLYGVPLDEFVRERDELARRLNRGGDAEAGARVKALRKPTVGAWALNQAVRRRRAERDALLATGKRLRTAHEELLGGGDPAVLRETMDEERSLTTALADCAEAIASETGKSGPALRDRVRATLHAAATLEDAREELASGRFVREREAVGLGPFGTPVPQGTDAPSAEPSGPKRSRAAGKRDRPSTKPRRERAAGAPREAEPRATRAERTAAPAEADAVKAEADAAGAETAPAETPASRVPDARLEEAERLLAEARDALTEAEADHAATLSKTESARKALDEAEVAEREARRILRELWREVAKRERRVDRMRPRP